MCAWSYGFVDAGNENDLLGLSCLVVLDLLYGAVFGVARLL